MNDRRSNRLVLNRDFNRHGESELHIGRECLISFAITFGTPKDSVLNDKFGDVITGLLEAGLTHKWYSDAMDDVAKSARNAKGRSRSQHTPYNFSQLQVHTRRYV